MPFQTQGKERLDDALKVRVTSTEKARLKEDADLAGVSVSELVRRRYFGRPLVAHADLVMIRELRRLGGLLKHLYHQSGGAHTQETAAALAELIRYLKTLSRSQDTPRSPTPPSLGAPHARTPAWSSPPKMSP